MYVCIVCRGTSSFRVSHLLRLLPAGCSTMSLPLRPCVLPPSSLSVCSSERDLHGGCAEGSLRDQEGSQRCYDERVVQHEFYAIHLKPTNTSVLFKLF